jgi:hypothetical protein
MEQIVAALVGILAAGGAVSVGVAALVKAMTGGYGTLIANLQTQNVGQQGQLDQLKLRAAKCEEQHDQFHKQALALTDQCPVTGTPCPLRELFRSKLGRL